MSTKYNNFDLYFIKEVEPPSTKTLQPKHISEKNLIFRSTFPNHICNAFSQVVIANIPTKSLVGILETFKYDSLDILPPLFIKWYALGIPLSEKAKIGSRFKCKILPMNTIKNKRLVGTAEIEPILESGAVDNLFNKNIPLFAINARANLEFEMIVEERLPATENANKPVTLATYFKDATMNEISDINRNRPMKSYDMVHRRNDWMPLEEGESYIFRMILNGHHSLESIFADSRKYLSELISAFDDPESLNSRLVLENLPDNRNELRLSAATSIFIGTILVKNHFQEFSIFNTVTLETNSYANTSVLILRSYSDTEEMEKVLKDGLIGLRELVNSFNVPKPAEKIDPNPLLRNYM